ncbi:MAG TPA: LamG-like jellyroll fold domain-containing protein [Terriglobales bacterium]|nr:LamG-like jellyroll fold domain-containing protein [Terriglobales bacterium]
MPGSAHSLLSDQDRAFHSLGKPLGLFTVLSFCLLFWLSTTAFSQNTPGLVAAYGFNEGAGNSITDVSGNGNNGTISGAIWNTSGRYGAALSFNGSTSRVNVPDSSSLDLTSGMTLEAWVRPSSVSSWRTVLLKEQSGGLVYGLYANSNSNRPSVHIYTSNEDDIRGNTRLGLNTWTHLAATYDGTVLRLFVNGTQVSSRTFGGSILTSAGALGIGGNSVWGEYFSGLIDEVRIYNRALTAAEIQTDMNTAVGGTPPPPPPPTDTTPPSASVTAPLNGATISGTTPLSATASDNVGVTGVQFLIDGASVGAEDTTAPYGISWDSSTVANGSHTIAARARDAAGNQTTSAPISVSVANSAPPPPPMDTTPPSVSITAPQNGATVSGTTTLSASASDNVGVTGVQFLIDGASIGAEDTTAPYGISWDSSTATNGFHVIAGRARDAAGNQTTSTAISVSVDNSAPPPPPPTLGLVAAYAFNEAAGVSTVDASGVGNNGTIFNATWNTAGRYGAALSFNGTNGRVDIPDSASLDLTSGMTLEAWIRATTLTSWRTVLLKEQSGGLVYGLYANSDTNRPSAHVYIGNETDTRGTTQIPLNVWTHVATTYDGSVLRLYVNGTQASSRTLGGNILSSSGMLRIGGNTVWGEYFSGLIDEVRLYNRALTASEIQTDMNTPIGSSSPPTSDTTAPTVSVTAPVDGATVSGAVTLTASASDNVGVAGVQFAIDGVPYGNEITTAPFTTTWDSATATNASHSITAVARDAAGNQSSSGPVTVTVANTSDAALIGSWSAPFNWPIVAINMVVTRTGEVLSWDGPPSNGGTSAQLWNPTTGAFTPIPNNVTNMFCNAAVVLADGRILAIGGHADFGVGVRNADIFDPVTKLWTPVAPMHHARWYPTATVLPDGRVIAVSGSDTCETCIADIPEIYDPSTNTWTEMRNARFSVNLYPFLFVLPDGRILEAGTTRQATTTRVLDLNTEQWTTIDSTIRDGHSAVMYEPGKIMKSGSAADVSVSTAPAASTTFTLDMTQPSPAWVQTPNMAFPRAFHSLTMLPDGTVLTTGGGSTRDGVNYANSVLAAEIWSPATKTWRTMASQQYGRLYHGSAVLLLDGRVLVAGSGRVGPDPQFNAEIFSPPYLFKGARPVISSSPADAAYGSSFAVGTPDSASVASVTLLRISAATHAFDMDQRFLRLSFSQTAGGLSVTAPANANLAPPGYYVMFILNSAGVPSRGAVIRIHQ